MKAYKEYGNREEIPVRPAVALLDERLWDTEGASLEIRRSQAKLSGKRTLFLTPLESLVRDTDGASLIS